MTRRFLTIALTVVVLAAAAYALWRWRAASPEKGPQLETAAVDRGRIVAKVTATGTLSALVTVQVGSQVSGRIQALYVDYNSQVKKGQLIARIDPQLFEASRRAGARQPHRGRGQPGALAGPGGRREAAVRAQPQPWPPRSSSPRPTSTRPSRTTWRRRRR